MNLGSSPRYLSRYVCQYTASPIKRRDQHPSFRTDSSFREKTHHSSTASQSVYENSRTKIKALSPASTLVHALKGHSVHLPIEYIQLLGLHPGEKILENEVLEAFAKFSAAEIEAGYSTRAMAGRQQLLEEAKEEGLKLVNRKPNSDSGKGIELASHLVPGALSLLVEVNQYDLVIQVGCKMLESSDSGNMKGDILLAMALSKLGQADDSFTVPNQVALACTRMEEALELLKSTGSPPLAPVLYKEIEDALETYVPRCVLDQLKLPLSEENSKGRREAMSILQGLLAVPRNRDFTFFGVDRHYVKQVMDCLTASEVLNAMDWTTILADPKSVKWYYPGLLLKGATVHIVIAFLEGRPALLRNLDSILNLPGKDREAHVEHVICKVLLGEVERAFEILERMEGSRKIKKREEDNVLHQALTEGENFMKSDQSIVGAKLLPGRNETLAFVKANSGEDPGDNLSGLCIFVERWLVHSGFSQFRDISSRPPSANLVDYFKDRKVENFFSANAGTNKPLFGMILNNKKTEDDRLSSPSSLISKPMDYQEMEPYEDPKEGGFGSSLDYESTIFDQSRGTPYINFQMLRNPAFLGAMLGGTILGSSLFLLFKNPWVRHQPREGPEPRYITKSEDHTSASLSHHDLQAKHKSKSSESNRMKDERVLTSLNKKEAEFLIRKWQFAKAEALGPKHDFHLMRKVLANPMLDTWTSNIREVQEQGWSWKYKLEKCKVTDIDISRCIGKVGHVEVYATLKESAIMYGKSGRALDEYNSRYNVAYQVILDKENHWKIKNVEILRSQR